jgi:presenilin-like A22 family membrane protease
MKHTWTVTAIFVFLFIVAQYVGLTLIGLSTDVTVNEAGASELSFSDTTLVGRPELTGWESVVYILVGVAIGTLILVFLANKKQVNIWRIWFLLAVWLSINIALGVVFKGSSIWIPIIIALVLTLWKVYAPNVYIQNLTEILTYAGIAVLLVPMLNVLSMVIILIIFSIYDAYAVWKSKHMVKMAEFTSQANLFPGLLVSYAKTNDNKTKLFQSFGKINFAKNKETEKKISSSSVSEKSSKSIKSIPKPPKSSSKNKSTESDDSRKTGVLGGGDVVFPLLFAGVVMLNLLLNGYSRQVAFSLAFIIVTGAVFSLLFLFYIGKKDKFYPAMPFITTGCLAGYGVMLLILLI